MRKIFVDTKIISAGDFDLCWRAMDLTSAVSDVVEPFIYNLAEKNILHVEKIAQVAGRQITHGVFAAGQIRCGH